MSATMSAAKRRSKTLMADFEEQLGTIFSFDDDEVWKAAFEAADEAVRVGQAAIAKRCEELNIPPEFAPGIGMGWRGRGQNEIKDRQVELRKMAQTRIAAIEAEAVASVELYSLETQTKLIADGLTSEAAQGFLANMPAVESLMPTFPAEEVRQLVLLKPAKSRSFDY